MGGRLLPLGAMPFQPPAGGSAVLGKDGTGAGHGGGADDVVLLFLALKRSLEELVDFDGAVGAAIPRSYLEDNYVPEIEQKCGDEQAKCSYFEYPLQKITLPHSTLNFQAGFIVL